jgi:hypothetical protein
MSTAEPSPPAPPPTLARTPRAARACRIAALVLVAAFLASIARSYHPRTGFTSLILFASHDSEVPAMADVPHAHTRAGYDGQFYAQLALVPLLKDPAIDRALDNPPYRARRILFSWTAYLLGLGRPAWIIQVYALQNVVCWLLLAWLLCRWLPPDTPRLLALWAACLFSQGMLASVRLALTDGPSLLVLACAAAAMERGRTVVGGAILGCAGLARETNLLGLSMIGWPRRRRAWLLAVVAVAIAVIPLLIWQDYLWSIYRSRSFANQNLLAPPLTNLLRKWQYSFSGIGRSGLSSAYMASLLAAVAVTTHAIFIVVHRRYDHVWWRLAAPFVLLMCVLDWPAWGGTPGAITRVLLPLTVGFNVLLRQVESRWFWVWYVLGNAGVVYAVRVLLR